MYRTNRRQRKATGRFYVFFAAIIVLAVGIAVGIRFLTNPSGGTSQQGGTQASITESPTVTPAPSGSVTSITDLYADEEGSVSVPLDESELVTIADEDLSVTEGLPSEWHNMLLLGQDTRDSSYNGRTDTMIIASVNTQTGKIKMCSILRDVVVDIEGVGLNRINAAHYYGGPNLIMKTINESFGMNITEYVSVNFASFPFIIEELGGVYVNVKEEELPYINAGVGNGIWEGKINGLDETKLDDSFLETYGTNLLLTGRQALAYARIRKLDSDFMRTARQRVVLNAVLQKVKDTTDAQKLLQMATSLLPYVKTNMETMTMVGLALPVLQNGVSEIEEMRLPIDDSYVSDVRDGMQAFFDLNLEANKEMLHDFIYG